MNLSDERKHVRQHKMLRIANRFVAAKDFWIIVTQKHELPYLGLAVKPLIAEPDTSFCPSAIVEPNRIRMIVCFKNIRVESAAVVVTECDSFSYEFVVEYDEECVVLVRIIPD